MVEVEAHRLTGDCTPPGLVIPSHGIGILVLGVGVSIGSDTSALRTKIVSSVWVGLFLGRNDVRIRALVSIVSIAYPVRLI